MYKYICNLIQDFATFFACDKFCVYMSNMCLVEGTLEGVYALQSHLNKCILCICDGELLMPLFCIE